jgi:hypothetical protein
MRTKVDYATIQYFVVMIMLVAESLLKPFFGISIISSSMFYLHRRACSLRTFERIDVTTFVEKSLGNELMTVSSARGTCSASVCMISCICCSEISVLLPLPKNVADRFCR